VKRHTLFNVLGVLVIASLALAACGTPAATEAPPEPQEPVATEAPAMELPYEIKPFSEPMVLDAGGCDYGGAVQSVEAVDEFTAVFTLCGPDPAFLSKMGFSVFGIYPQEWLEWATQADNVESRLRHPIGSGPYMIDEWVSGESLTLTANPAYWGDAPHAETLVFRWTTESAARTLELQSGEVDGIDNPGPDDFAVIQGDANLALIDRPALNTFYMPDQHLQPWMMSTRGDRHGHRPTAHIVAPSTRPEVASHFAVRHPNGCTGDEWYEFDPEAAKALLAGAGFPDGFSTLATGMWCAAIFPKWRGWPRISSRSF
jgi:ABC-type transport system substrate-binding protein